MRARRIKFIWGASRVIKGRWFLGLFGLYERAGAWQDGLAVSVRGLLGWAALLALMLYVTAAWSLSEIWRQNPYNQLTRADAFLYPWRQREITEKKGQAFIAQGIALIRANKWHDGANVLRLGLARCPRDFSARRVLAEFYERTNQQALAWRVLQEGLAAQYPGRAHLATVFGTAEHCGDFDFIARTAARYSPQVERDGSLADLRWLMERRFSALIAAERTAEALALAETEETGDRASEHRVLALLALGRAPETLPVLAEWRARSGADLTALRPLEVRAFREAKRFDEMEQALASWRALSPGDPSPLVCAVTQQAVAGRAAAAVALDDYIFRFGGTAENLARLTGPLAEIGEVALLQRLTAAARERGYPLRRFQAGLVQACVQRGQWAAAARTLDDMPIERADSQAPQAWREWMRRLIAATRSHGAVDDAALLEFLRHQPWSEKVFRQSIDTLQRAGRMELARDTMLLAQHAFPASSWLRAEALAGHEAR